MIQILRFLEDGAWHSLNEIATEAKVPVGYLRDCCPTLSKQEIIEYDEALARIRIGRELMSIIKMMKTSNRDSRRWGKMGAGTVIVPPQRRFQIQGVSLQNMTEQDLKIEFTFNMKPIEIVISTA